MKSGIFLLVGFLLGVLGSVAGNLLTPWSKRLWAGFLSFQKRSYRSRIEQQIKPLQTELDQLDRFKTSDRDLYLSLFQSLLAIIACCIAALAFLVLATTSRHADDFLALSLVLFIIAAVITLVMGSSCRNWTTVGMPKRTAKLQADIAKLRSKLSE